MNWTEEQREVIETRDKNILVSAAAGSGKTAVLTERILTLVTDKEHPVDIDRLVVVTFTRAAAAEMRERILKALQKKAEMKMPICRSSFPMCIMQELPRLTAFAWM